MGMIRGRDVEDVVLHLIDQPVSVTTADHSIIITYKRPTDRDNAVALLRRLRGGNPADK